MAQSHGTFSTELKLALSSFDGNSDEAKRIDLLASAEEPRVESTVSLLRQLSACAPATEYPASETLEHLESFRALGKLALARLIVPQKSQDAPKQACELFTLVVQTLGVQPTVVERRAAVKLCLRYVATVPRTNRVCDGAVADPSNPMGMESAIRMLRDSYVAAIKRGDQSLKTVRDLDYAVVRERPAELAAAVDKTLTRIAERWKSARSREEILQEIQAFPFPTGNVFVSGLDRVWAEVNELREALKP